MAGAIASGFAVLYPTYQIDSLEVRHPGEGRGPALLQLFRKTGFRPSPE
jgi:hypothetical protein